MKPFNIFIVVLIIVILGGLVFFSNGFNKVQSNKASQSGLLMDIPGYLNYSENALVNSQKKGKTVLFFAATTWCQTCSILEKEIIERQIEIPGDVTILKVDYDNDKAMNRKWRITSQHTLVVLNKSGNELVRWVGGGFDSLLQRIEDI